MIIWLAHTYPYSLNIRSESQNKNETRRSNSLYVCVCVCEGEIILADVFTEVKLCNVGDFVSVFRYVCKCMCTVLLCISV